MANELHEFHRNYESCFFRIKLKLTQEPRAFYLTSVDYDTKKLTGKTITQKLLEKSATFNWDEFKPSMDPIIPYTGYLNTTCWDRPSVLYLQTFPDRQFRKALSLEGRDQVAPLIQGSPKQKEYLQDKKSLADFCLRTAAHTLAKNTANMYYPFRQALAAVESGHSHAVAISRFFAISLHQGIKHPCLFHRNTLQGTIIGNKVFVLPLLLPYKDFFQKRWDVQLKLITEG